MKARKVIGISVLVVVALALLAAGGYAIYRLGYSQGVQSSWAQNLPERLETMRPDGFRGRFDPEGRGRLPQTFRGFTPLAAGTILTPRLPLLGLCLAGLGLLALAVSAVVLLRGRNSPSGTAVDTEHNVSEESD